TITNVGPGIARNLVITEIFPAGVTPINTEGYTCSFGIPGDPNQPTICAIGDVSVGTFTGTFTLKVADNLSAGTVLSNTVTVSSDVSDPNPSDNSFTATTTIVTDTGTTTPTPTITQTPTPSATSTPGASPTPTF